MKLSYYEILEANNGLGALATILISQRQVKRARQIKEMVYDLRKYVELFNSNQTMLLQSFGQLDRQLMQHIIEPGTEEHKSYEAAFLELLEEEKEFDFESLPILTTELELLKAVPGAQLAVLSVVEVVDELPEG
jgi:hypothetical protein